MNNESIITNNVNTALELMRDYRDELSSLPDDESGRPHSHGETDNTRGLRIRAVSMAISDMESACKRLEDAFNEELGEYYLPVK